MKADWTFDLEFTATQAARMETIAGKKLATILIRHCVKQCRAKGIRASIGKFKKAKKHIENGIVRIQSRNVMIRYRIKEDAA